MFRRPPPPPVDPLVLPNLSGTYIGAPRSAAGLMRPARPAHPAALPPPHLRHYYGLRDGQYDDSLYLQGGAHDAQRLRDALTADGFTIDGPVLDFGCGAGRMIRHLTGVSPQIWGVDIHAEAIAWAQDNLSPPFDFALTTTAPHLPFEDRSFALIYAGSVFTHIGDLADAWLLELRRILQPDGRLYISITDAQTLAEIQRIQPKHASHQHLAALDRDTGYHTQDWQMLMTRSGPWAQRVIYDRDALTQRLTRWFDLRRVIPQGYGWQTVLLLRKRP